MEDYFNLGVIDGSPSKEIAGCHLILFSWPDFGSMEPGVSALDRGYSVCVVL